MPVGFAREFLQITKESAYKVKKTTPVRGTDQIAIRLDGANQFTPRAVPVAVPVMYGGGLNVEAATISDKTEIKGSLTSELCYSQAAFLLGLALTKMNAGQTVPWTSTEPVNQFASVWIDHAVWQDDSGTYKRTAYPGCKVDTGSVATSESDQKVMLNLGLIGSSFQGNTYDSSADPTSTEFPQPTDVEYPTDFVTFIHSNAGFLFGGSAFLPYTSLNFSWQHNHAANFYANRFAQSLRAYGSKFKLDSDVTLVASPAFRSQFQYLTAITPSLAFTDGAHTITFDFKANARIEGLDDNLPLGTIYQRKLSIGSRYDSTANTDFGFTYA